MPATPSLGRARPVCGHHAPYHGMLLSSRPARIDSVLNTDVPRDIIAPTDLSRITDNGEVNVVDSARSALIREPIGSFKFRRAGGRRLRREVIASYRIMASGRATRA